MAVAADPPLELWLVDIERAASALDHVDATLDLLSQQQQADAPARQPDRAKQLAHCALRILLAGHIGIAAARRPFIRAAGGKPHVDAAHLPPEAVGLEFSLAHAGDVALVAISKLGPVGVDVEARRPIRLSEVRRTTLESAAAALAPADPLPTGPADDRFLQAWVRLEALAKATGEGVGALLGRIREATDGTASVAPSENGLPSLLIRDLALDPTRGYRAAVASVPGAVPAAGPALVPAMLPADIGWLESWVRAGTSPRTSPDHP